MRKALLFVLLLTVPFTFGCPSPRNDNAGNANNVNNATPVAEVTATPDFSTLTPHNEKDVVLSIVPNPFDPSSCVYSFITTGTPLIKQGKGKIRWIVKNNCNIPNDVKVVIEEFKRINGPEMEPFGPPEDSCNPNRIVIDPIAYNEEGRVISRTAKGVKGSYTYRVKLFINGVEQLVAKEHVLVAPQIEIGG